MKRRSFFPFLAAPALAGIPSLRAEQAGVAPAMKITRLETTYWRPGARVPWNPNWVWLRVHTDSGLVGLGETYPRNEAEAALVHSSLASVLVGRDPRDIERIWADLYRLFDVQVTGGAEMRVLSALDLALWDLLGKSLNVPVYRLLGGRSNSEIRVYNTCFDLRYDFTREPEKIMRELIDRYGIKAIKIWPFDRAAQRNRHEYVTTADLEEGLAPVRKLRDAFGNEIEILLEFHSGWNLTAAIRIARALEPYQPMWLEDMLLPGNFGQYRELAEATSLPLTISERMAGRMQFLQLLESRAARYVMFDVTWCGGLSEAKKIAAMAEAFQLPVAPHTAGGPLLFYASTHLSTALANLAIQESCQVFYESTWPRMLVNPIIPRNGFVRAPELPGLGMEIKPEVWTHPEAITRTSSL
ncbi:MAG TPA: mandelate racemase/muconate lactonizing enzyme family protein [Terriglobia bacterium]|jgi:L-alanine-DL-glutamate epimerase-like enolase superfamily enzyme|nr:mandelate racemase/muconate lactonizing enzyme family protein [Terriglobia bacterium]